MKGVILARSITVMYALIPTSINASNAPHPTYWDQITVSVLVPSVKVQFQVDVLPVHSLIVFTALLTLVNVSSAKHLMS